MDDHRRAKFSADSQSIEDSESSDSSEEVVLRKAIQHASKKSASCPQSDIMTINMRGNSQATGKGTAADQRLLVNTIISECSPSVIFCQEIPGKFEKEVVTGGFTSVETGKEVAVMWLEEDFHGVEVDTTETFIVRIAEKLMKERSDVDTTEVRGRLAMVILLRRTEDASCPPFLAVSWHGPYKAKAPEASKVLKGLHLFLCAVCEHFKVSSYIIGGDFNLNTFKVGLEEALVVASYNLTARARTGSSTFIPYKDNFLVWNDPTSDGLIRVSSVKPFNFVNIFKNDEIKQKLKTENSMADLLDHDPITGTLCFSKETVKGSLRRLRQIQLKGNDTRTTDQQLVELKKIALVKGFNVIDNDGEGNCMFMALVDQLEVQGKEYLHGELRKRIVQYLKDNPKLPDGTHLFVFVYGHQSWEGYLQDMEEMGTWGDHVILLAAARLFNTRIRVISNLPYHDIIINPALDTGDGNDNCLVLGHIPEFHYVSLRASPIKRSLQCLRQIQVKGNDTRTTDQQLVELKKIALDKGFNVIENDGEGNCMFMALVDQLEVQGKEYLHGELRKRIVQYLKDNPTLPDGTHLFEFVDGHQSWNNYLRHMGKKGIWGDHVILFTAARFFNTRIRVISNLPYHDINIDPALDTGDGNDSCLVLGHISELHYVSLRALPDVTAEATISLSQLSLGSESSERSETGYCFIG